MTRLTRRQWLQSSSSLGAAVLLLGRPYAVRASRSPAAEVAEEIDSHYYYPQKHGLKEIVGQFEVSELEKRLRNTILGSYQMDPNAKGEPPKISLEGLYSWDADKRTTFAIDGWPKGYDPLELKRHQGVHQQMAELIVPDEHSYFFRDFDIQVERPSTGLVVTGRKKVAYSRVDSFTKTFSRDFLASNLKGAGPEAVFQTDTQYHELKGKRVFKSIEFKVRVGSVDLHYKIEPYYLFVDGYLLPATVTLTYFDSNGQVSDVPFQIVAKQYAVNAKARRPATQKK